MGKTSAKPSSKKQTGKKDNFPLDTVLEKPRRGRPLKIQPSWVRGRADNYRDAFTLIWDRVWPGLSKAETSQDVTKSFNDTGIPTSLMLELIPLASLILQVMHDLKFPKRKREAQIKFLADSIGAHGMLTPRSSRDVCDAHRARINQVHRILAYEYSIQCSCGYKGTSRNHACPMCEAEIPSETDSPFDYRDEES